MYVRMCDFSSKICTHTSVQMEARRLVGKCGSAYFAREAVARPHLQRI